MPSACLVVSASAWREASSFVQTAANAGASRTITSGLIDWNHEAGIS